MTMTLSEFRAWMDGFKEAIGEAPTQEQWAKVIEKLALVYEPLPTVLPHIVGPYLPTSPSVAPGWPFPGNVWCGPASSVASAGLSQLDAIATNAIFTNVEALYEN